MALERLARWAVPGAVLTGGALFALGIVAWATPSGFGTVTPDEARLYVIEGFHGIAAVGMMAALIGLHRWQASQSGRLGMVGFWIAFVGAALLLANAVLSMASAALRGDAHVLGGILFDGVLLASLVGFPLLGIATLRAKVFPAWVGILLLGWYLLFIIVGPVLVWYVAAYIVVGLMWLAIGYGLWEREQAISSVAADEASVAAAGGGGYEQPSSPSPLPSLGEGRGHIRIGSGLIVALERLTRWAVPGGVTMGRSSVFRGGGAAGILRDRRLYRVWRQVRHRKHRTLPEGPLHPGCRRGRIACCDARAWRPIRVTSPPLGMDRIQSCYRRGGIARSG